MPHANSPTDDLQATGRRVERRPMAAWVTVGLVTFIGLTAFGGGIEMLVFFEGNRFVPAAWLEHIPLIDSRVLPGLVLGSVFGIGSLITAWAVLQKPEWNGVSRVEVATGDTGHGCSRCCSESGWSSGSSSR